MKTNKLEDLTNEELLKQKKLLSTASGAFAGTLSGLIIMIIILVLKSGMSTVTIALSTIPIALLPIVFSIISKLKLIKKELETRNL
jgi:hypothetical protein